jgi:hypothetical protein
LQAGFVNQIAGTPENPGSRRAGKRRSGGPAKIFENFQKLKKAKVAFSGFLLGNREKIAFVANANFSRFREKLDGRGGRGI